MWRTRCLLWTTIHLISEMGVFYLPHWDHTIDFHWYTDGMQLWISIPPKDPKWITVLIASTCKCHGSPVSLTDEKDRLFLIVMRGRKKSCQSTTLRVLEACEEILMIRVLMNTRIIEFSLSHVRRAHSTPDWLVICLC